MAGIPLSSGFNVSAGIPLDLRTTVATIVDRDNIPTIGRYKGLLVFVESDSKYYYLKTGITNSDWVELSGFTSHTHTKADITDFSHTHTKSDITDFAHTHTKSDITDFSHTHSISDVSGLQTALDNKVNTSDVVTTATANKILKLDANAKLPASITGNADGNAATASKLQTARTITLSGDVSGSASFDGSANAAISTALSNTGVAAGTYTKLTVDSKGRATAGTNLSASDLPTHNHTKSQITDFSHTHIISDVTNLQTTLDSKVDDVEVVTIATANKILKLNSSAKLPADITGNAGTATKLLSARTITIGNMAKGFDGSANVSWSLTEIGAAAASHTHTKSQITDFAHTHPISEVSNLQTTLDGKEPAFSKNTAFNKNFGTVAGTVSEGNHTHPYLPLAGGTMSNTNLVANLNADLLDGYNESRFMFIQTVPSGADFNTLIRQGNYRLSSNNTNGPGGTIGDWSQLLVLRESDTISQVLLPYNSDNMYFRSGNPTDVGGSGVWRSWSKVWNDRNDGSGSGLDADLLDGYHSSSFALASHTHTKSQITDFAHTHTPSEIGAEPAITKSTGYLKWNGSAWTFLNESYALSNHTHSNNYVPYATGFYTVPANTGKWVRIATSPVGVGMVYGRFILEYTVSGYHGMVEFEVANQYNNENSVQIVKIYSSNYDNTGVGIQYARLVYKYNVYSNEYCYVEVYVHNYNVTSSLSLTIKGMHLNNLTISTSDGSIPTGYGTEILSLQHSAPLYSTDDKKISKTDSSGYLTIDCRYKGKNSVTTISDNITLQIQRIPSGYSGIIMVHATKKSSISIGNCTRDDGITITSKYRTGNWTDLNTGHYLIAYQFLPDGSGTDKLYFSISSNYTAV